MTLPWIIAAAAAGLLAGPRIRASVFARSTEDGPPRRACPECSRQVLTGRWLWCSVLPATGRCPRCKARIGPDALAIEVVTGLVLGVAAARASSGWELAALAWLALIAVPLAFIDLAVQRLPDLLTVSAFAGTLVLLAAAEGAAHQPWLLIRAVIGAAALTGFYLALWLIFPDQLGLGDVKLAASIGLVLAWGGWSELFLGALAGALLGAVYAQVVSARRAIGGRVYLPLGPFLLLGAFAAIALLPVQVPDPGIPFHPTVSLVWPWGHESRLLQLAAALPLRNRTLPDLHRSGAADPRAALTGAAKAGVHRPGRPSPGTGRAEAMSAGGQMTAARPAERDTARPAAGGPRKGAGRGRGQ